MGIYLDHNAGAPIRPEVHDAITALLDSGAANPASVHRSGQAARRMLEAARRDVGTLIGAAPAQIVFCSGGTEANNLAIDGTLRAARGRRTIIGSAIEHSSILKPLAHLQAEGFEVVYAWPDRQGRLDPGAIIQLIGNDTALVTLGLANSEVGTIQDLAPLAAPIHAAGAIFHIDAAQAAGRIPVDVSQLQCDLMTLSGHKLGAPSGIGALFVRDPSRIAPLILGGPQERGQRAGTPNLIGAVGFGAAAAVAHERLGEESSRMIELRDLMLHRLIGSIPGLLLNSPRDRVLPGTLNLQFPGVLGETMLIALDLEGVEVSMGSACAAGAVEPSHVLIAMGHGAAAARSSLRISLGYSTTLEEVEQACAIIAAVWQRIAPPASRHDPVMAP
jgi:cysteine desulfurase